ncbi:MAG: hypothetical protein AAB400_02110 [Patescibacteria group bacterium]
MINSIHSIIQTYISSFHTWKDWSLFVSGVLFIGGFIPYATSILRRETVPVKVTWTLGFILDVIVLIGMLDKGKANFQIVGACFGAGITMLLSWSYGAKGWKPIDVVSACGAVLGILLWKLFGDSLVGIIIACVTMFVACVPMLQATWIDPSKEDKLSWTIFYASCVFAVCGVKEWTLVVAAQPVTFLLIELSMVLLVYLRPPALSKTREKQYFESPL